MTNVLDKPIFTNKAPEAVGDFYFTGRLIFSIGFDERVKPSEAHQIITDIELNVHSNGVHHNKGLPRIVKYESEDGREVWAVDYERHWTLMIV